jgi:cell wall-associated NlpC family hydrolase
MGKMAVNKAIAEIGYTEFPKDTNKTKYGKWFGLDGVAWCGIFVSWCYDKAGTPLPNIGFTKGFAGCQTAVAYFKKNGLVTDKPEEGDIVFFDWNGDGRYDHTGIFVQWNTDGTFVTVEGNTDKTFVTIEGNTSIGNDSNGGTVMKRKRKNKNVLFVHI